jgi:hypothetical protein
MVARAAALVSAALTLHARAEAGAPIAMPATGRPMAPSYATCFHELVSHALVRSTSAPLQRGGGVQLSYTEGARHIAVGYGGSFYEVEVVEPGGRCLTAAEIRGALAQVVAMDKPPACALPTAHMSLLPHDEYRAMVTALVTHGCEVNAHSVDVLDRALLFVALDATLGAAPSLGITDAAPHWLGNALALSVGAGGAAVLRASALLGNLPSLAACASWLVDAADAETFAAPVLPTTVSVRAMRHIPGLHRASVTAAPPRRSVTGKAKEAPVAVVAAEPPQQHVTIDIPPPAATQAPRRVPFWAPREHVALFTAAPAAPPAIANVRVRLHRQQSLHLAVMLAVNAAPLDGDGGEAPGVGGAPAQQVQLLSWKDPCVPRTTLCRSDAIDSAVCHVRQFAKFGPKRTEVMAACVAAVDSIVALSQRAPFVTQLQAARTLGYLAGGSEPGDGDGGRCASPFDGIDERPALLVAHAPGAYNLAWAFESTAWPPRCPVLSYTALPGQAADATGVEYQCTLLNYDADAAAAFAATVQGLAAFVNGLVPAKVASRPPPARILQRKRK